MTKSTFKTYNNSDKPTQLTEKALVEARAKELGLIPDDSREFDNVNELMKYLND